MACKLCGGVTELILSLGSLPLVNALLDHAGEPFERYPLDLMFCRACVLGQIGEFVAPERMFEEYTYFTSVNGPMVVQAKKLAQTVLSTLPSNLYKGLLVAEIGSNDGYLLREYQRFDSVRVLGIDPARGPANAAALLGVPTVQAFFTEALAKTLPQADVIHAHNVLAHVPDLEDFAGGIAAMSKPDGIVIIEVPDLREMATRCEFDTIYHEHGYYFSFEALVNLFQRKRGLFLSRYEQLDAHGGSLRLWFDHKGKEIPRPHEQWDDLDSFATRAASYRKNLRDYLLQLRAEGKRIWGFGAAAKATVMLNYCGIDSSLIEKIADDTPAKQGKFIPGTGIQIAPTSEWLAAQPDYTCIFAWNYADVICNRYHDMYNGRFFTPYELVRAEVHA